MKVLAVLMAATVLPAAARAAPEAAPEGLKQALEQGVREILEPALKQSAGVGFRSFSCVVPPDFTGGQRFTCEAIDDEGAWLGYSIRVEEDGTATVVLASERASELDAESRKTLEAPCRRFLERYRAGDWEALEADVHPALRSNQSYAAAASDLRDMREVFGEVRSEQLEIHGVRESGRNELVYELACERGNLSARFGLEPDDRGVWRVIAFLLSAPPGSPEQGRLLERVARRQLTEMIGTPVVALDAPIEGLLHPGDAVEGAVELEGGGRMPVRVAQTGWKDDFDPVDYRFSILDAAWLVRRALGEQLPGLETVECDAAVVPDGGETACTAIGGNGARLDVVVSRSGGEHRMRRRMPSGG